MKIAVAGGTGILGRLVVEAAEEDGHDVVVLARSRGVDLVSGSGLAAALVGVEVAVDVCNAAAISAEKSVAFFTATTRSLLAAEKSAGVRHHLAVSIVGVDRAPVGYYAGKRAQERLIEDGMVPWTIMRATQFHEFVGQVYAAARIGPVHIAPRMRTQPVAAREVAHRVLELATAEPSGFAAEFAGPREESLVAMIRAYAKARGSHTWIPAVPLPGAYGRAQRDGSLLPGPGSARGVQTFADWLRTL